MSGWTQFFAILTLIGCLVTGVAVPMIGFTALGAS